MDVELWIPSGDFNPRRYRPGGIGNWSGHLPFAFDLVAAVKPKIFTELGTHYGESYFGFCQSIAEQSKACSCYSVDTWVGEDQAGHYGEEVFENVQAYNDAHYKTFSYLLRTTFDQAVESFAEDSIDILHIDGLHTYDAVKHDFQTWLPKVRPGGIVLLHDTAARHADFGVWKLWEELEGTGDRILFTHGWGLGVFRKPARDSEASNDLLSSFFHADPAYANHLQKFYTLRGSRLDQEYRESNQAIGEARPGSVEAQVFPMVSGSYSLERCSTAIYAAGQWQKIAINLPHGLGEDLLRFDPAQQPSVIDVAGVSLCKAQGGEKVWSLTGVEVTALSAAADLVLLSADSQEDFCRFFSTGNDPQIFFPPITDLTFSGPLVLEIWIRALVEPASLVNEIKSREEALRTILCEMREARSIGVRTVQDLTETPTERQLPDPVNLELQELKEENAKLAGEREMVLSELERLTLTCRGLQGDLYVTKGDLIEAEKKQVALRGEISDTVHARNVEAERCRMLEGKVAQIFGSRSWRVTAPLRNFKGPAK